MWHVTLDYRIFRALSPKAKIPRDNFPRSILVTSSRGCHEDATRKTASIEFKLMRSWVIPWQEGCEVSVCLSFRISQKPHARASPNFYCISTVAWLVDVRARIARGSSRRSRRVRRAPVSSVSVPWNLSLCTHRARLHMERSMLTNSVLLNVLQPLPVTFG